MKSLPKPDLETMFRRWNDLTTRETRFVGSPGEQQAIHIITEALTNLGLDVHSQEFEQPTFSLQSPLQLALISPDTRTLPCHIMLGSEPTPAEGIEGRLHYIGRQGVIGILEWEKYVVEDKDGHAVAYVLGRPDGEAMPQPLALGSTTTPHFVIGQHALHVLREAHQKSRSLICRGSFRAAMTTTTCRNLFAHFPGSKTGNAIFISAHYDSMYSTPGANDNAAGIVALLTLACWLAENPPLRDVTLAFFAAEEWGLAGSTFYVSQIEPENLAERVHFLINLDGIAEGPSLQAWVGSEVLESEIRHVVAKERQPIERPQFRFPPLPGSDHWPFAERGIMTCMFTRGDPVHWHQPSDLPRQEAVAGIASVLRLTGLLVRELS